MTDENEASQEPILIMGFEPDPERTPEDVRQWYSQDRSEAGLAKAFAAASNKFWWVEDNIYDYPEGTPEHQEACRITDAWGAVMDELEHEIFAILRREGVEIPKTGRIGCSSRLWNETDTATEAAGGYRRNRANPIPMPDPDRPTAAQIKEILPANRKDFFFWENR